MSVSPKTSTVTAYRVKSPLHAFSGRLLIDTVIPAGSTVEWQQGEYFGGLASVFWLRRRVLVMEAELFAHCDQLTEYRITGSCHE